MLPSLPEISGKPFDASSYFSDFDTKEIPELEEAKRVMIILLQEIVSKNWKLDEPIIIGIHSWPGRWKSHLISCLERWLRDANIGFCSTQNDQYLLSQKQHLYKQKSIIISDDLFQNSSILPRDIHDRWSPAWTDFQSLPELIFDVYDWNKIWLLSSNFDIHDVLNRVAESDDVWRLKSRITQLLWSVQPINLNTAPDHRETLAQEWTKLRSLFAKKVAAVVDPE